MKKLVITLLFFIAITACGQSPQNTGNNTAQISSDPNIVNVLYFHGKQRCVTCIAVGNVAKATIEKTFTDKTKVRFIEIDTSEKVNAKLVEKYKVTWNALIIAKGENFVEITQQAFATAVNNPQSLENLIKVEVNKRL